MTPTLRLLESSASPTATHDRSLGNTGIGIIPINTVRRLYLEAECRIAAERRETDTVLLRRAQRQARNMRMLDRAYETRLQAVEAVGLFHMGPSLTQFFNDHERMWRATTRTFQIAERARCDLTVDVLTHVNIRILDIRNRFSRRWIMSTCSPHAIHAMRVSGEFDANVSNLKDLLTNEFTRVLRVWDELASANLEVYELENLGPDHNIDDLGRVIDCLLTRCDVIPGATIRHHLGDPLRNLHMQSIVTIENRSRNYQDLPTPPPSPKFALEDTTSGAFQESQHDDQEDTESDEDGENEDPYCSICTESYTANHRAFRLARCGHIFGKACISRWVNSTALNANLCPECRAELCARRPRRPRPGLQVAPNIDDQNRLQSRLDRTTQLFGQLADVYAGLQGPESRNGFFDDCMAGLNERFFMEDVAWIVVPDETLSEGWRLHGHDWHA